MIWHLFEIWLVLLVGFFAGCLLGVALYGWLAQTRFATTQGVVADRVGDVIDNIKEWLEVGPVWRPGARVSIERPAAADFADGERGADMAGGKPPYPDEDPRHLPPGEEATWRNEPEWPPEGQEEVDFAGGADIEGVVIVEPPSMAEEAAAGQEGEEEEPVAMRPAGLSGPRNGVPDDLQRIRGIGKRNEELLNSLGIYHFGQIAAWTPAEMRWVGAYLAFPERIERDDWIGQATILASGGKTNYVKGADRKRAKDADDEA